MYPMYPMAFGCILGDSPPEPSSTPTDSTHVRGTRQAFFE